MVYPIEEETSHPYRRCNDMSQDATAAAKGATQKNAGPGDLG
jgi:hypothetical protein